MEYISFIDNNGEQLFTNADEFLVKDLTLRLVKHVEDNKIREIICNSSYRVSFNFYALYDDESVKEDLSKYVLAGGRLSITNNCGVRRKLSLNIYNAKSWMPSPFNGFLWKGSRFKLEIIIKTTLAEYVYPAGVFILSDFNFSHKYKNNEISLELVDKFGILDGTVGGNFADNIYIPRGSNIVQVIKSLLKSHKIEGVPYDVRTPLLPAWTYSAVTPHAITEVNSTIGSLIIKLLTMINLEPYYNEYGRLTVEEMQENIMINYNPPLWEFFEGDGLYSVHDSKVNFQSVENIIVVEGANINGNIISARVENTNPKSLTNITLFEPKIKKIVDENISNDSSAYLRANYELFKSSLIPISHNFSTVIIPILDVNKVITITDSNCGFKNTKFLINSIDITITSCPKMDISISNLEEVAFNVI